ncbi:hypothetical protein SAMN04489844_2537 [Nocardioides exalbidus]|uniref:DUF559 domain-containing protein n=1 Tax=Nocardioides exalbidus TaxID=402596 RepID=A0A1H4TKE7_9ACTN|nr:hypothetical protein [Nocardioides exalbidus]SEC56601.1 hypothetical protein SAMN04489844_2537 [Nocardioides exalbidus]
MRSVPEAFRHGPFSRQSALAAGVTARVFEGVQFRRLHEAVYVHRDHEMTWDDHVEAARLALPASARTTGATRLRQLGIDVGSPFPLHFVVEGDLHLVLDGVFLHRTVKMPPSDDVGASVEAAFVAYCADVRLVDAIRVGCFLLHQEHLDGVLLDQILTEERWRRGVPETSYVLPFLDDRPRSIPEAELLAYVVFSGLVIPEVNEKIALRDGTELTPDLHFEDHDLVVEYEGGQHADDRGQYLADIDRFAAYRRDDKAYEQVTRELMRSPKAVVRRIHGALRRQGYDGPEPDFDGAWLLLFRRLEDLAREARAA